MKPLLMNIFEQGNDLCLIVLIIFQDKSSGMFYFTSDEDRALISRKIECLIMLFQFLIPVLLNFVFAFRNQFRE